MAKREKSEQVGFWGNVDPGVKTGLVVVGSTVLIGGTLLYVASRKIRRQKSRQILKKAMIDGTLESIVEKIDMALVGMGTDEEKIYEAYCDIPTQEDALTVADLYYKAYSETLDDALRGDIGEVEMQTVKNITASKPERKNASPNYNLLEDWHRRLKISAGTFSTDEDEIFRVLWEVPDRKGYQLLSDAIKNKKEIGYAGITEYLTAQLGDGELEHAKYIINRKK
jgi:hypothetical protein